MYVLRYVHVWLNACIYVCMRVVCMDIQNISGSRLWTRRLLR